MQSMYENVPPVSHVREVYGAECEAPYRAPPLPLRTLTYPIRHTLPRALGRPPALPAPLDPSPVPRADGFCPPPPVGGWGVGAVLTPSKRGNGQ